MRKPKERRTPTSGPHALQPRNTDQGRAQSGFTVNQMVAEFRALRASVLRLWGKQPGPKGEAELEEMVRFNEAIDQAIAESLARYTQDIDQTKERFLAILGHDLRTPLGAIIMSAQFILECGELVEPYRGLVDRIGKSSRRMNQMVADLLDFSRTRLGDTIPIARAEMDVTRMLDDVVAEVAASYPDCKLEVEASGELHGVWDCARLTQAMTNLIGNAAQHGSDDTPIRVTARGEAHEVIDRGAQRRPGHSGRARGSDLSADEAQSKRCRGTDVIWDLGSTSSTGSWLHTGGGSTWRRPRDMVRRSRSDCRVTYRAEIRNGVAF
jgi:signal transduction histidine kinase